MARKKIALIGGGQIGGNLALLACQKELGDVIIYDIPQAEGMTKGKALDIMQLRPHDGYDGNLSGTSDPASMQDADVVIITAGVPRKPGMDREDLLDINIKIITDVANNVKKYAPNAFVIVVSNPLDAIVYSFYKVSGFAKNKVMAWQGPLTAVVFGHFWPWKQVAQCRISTAWFWVVMAIPWFPLPAWQLSAEFLLRS